MKTTEDHEKDLNGRFMNPESIEKAPEGFTNNVMSAVRVESILVVRKRVRSRGYIVPAAVLVIMLVLVVISVFAGSDTNTIAGGEFSKLLQKFALLKIKEPSLPGLSLPGIAIYISLGVFVLLIFDQVLGKIFYRRE